MQLTASGNALRRLTIGKLAEFAIFITLHSSIETNRAVAKNKTFEMKQPVRIEGEIVSYDNEREEPVEYCNIDLIPFEEIISIVVPKADDPALSDGYPLTNEQGYCI